MSNGLIHSLKNKRDLTWGSKFGSGRSKTRPKGKQTSMPYIHPLCRLVSGTLLAAITAFSPFYSLAAHSFVAPSVTAVTSRSAAIVAPSPTSTQQLLPQTPLVIGEVAWAGSSLSTADEWLELWNTGDAPLSLTGWSLRGASATPLLNFPSNASIPPHGVYLVSNTAATDPKSALATTTQFVTKDISLSNTQLKIELLDAMGAIVDRAGNGSTPPAGVSVPTKISMLRLHPLADGSTANAWANATSSQNFKSGMDDLGTPGVCDGCGSIIVTQTSLPPTTSAAHLLETSSSTRHATTIASNAVVPSLIHATSAVFTPTTNVSSTIASLHTTTTVLYTKTVVVTSTFAFYATTTMAHASSSGTLLHSHASNISSSLQTPIAQTQSVQKFDEKPKSNYNMLRLNEVTPSPISGTEWIEIATLDASQILNLRGCAVHDANGRIHLIGEITINPAISRYAVISFPKARLNNAGDRVALYAPDGRLLDVVSYGATQKGESWVRFPDMIGDWEKTSSSTPNAPNERASQAMLHKTARDTVEQPAQGWEPVIDKHAEKTVSTTALEQAGVSVLQPSDQVSVTELNDVSPQESRESLPQASPHVASADTTGVHTRVRRETQRVRGILRTSRTAMPIHQITFDMLQQDTLSNLRVRLTGRVGSLPGLVARRAFILQNSDGRGLLVTVPSRQRVPQFGNDVATIGALRIDDKGTASLRMSTKDTWSPLPTSTIMVRPRIVDLLAPSAEDAWSLINVTGTVTHIKSGAVQLDLGDAELAVVIKPLVRYRAKRLVVGDVISVNGLLDLTRDDPRLLPRSAEDISLVTHAPPKQLLAAAETRPQGPVFPNWVPLGAAGGAVAVTEGVKRFHRRRKMRALAHKAANASS